MPVQFCITSVNERHFTFYSSNSTSSMLPGLLKENKDYKSYKKGIKELLSFLRLTIVLSAKK